MRKKTITSASEDIILNLKVLAEEKESVRQKLAVTAAKLAVTAQKLAKTAKEKEVVRRKLAITAKQLAITARKLNGSHATLEKKVRERTKSLEMSRVKEEAILLSIGDGLIVTDEKGLVTIINTPAERLLEKKSKEIIGAHFSIASSLVDEKGVSIPIEQHPISMALKTRITITTLADFSYYHIRKDGTRFPVAITATPVILDGKVIGTIKVFRDITFEREVDKAKTEFVSLASHQLRTPLSAVNWYSEMLLAGDVGELNEKQKKYLEEVYRSNQRMVELVNALLDVASLELGTFVVESQSTDVHKLASSVISEQQPQINSKKIKFSFSCDKKISFIQADPKLLRMVMQNILSNALKYTPDGGKIHFTLLLKDRKDIFIKVSDNGYGIPLNQQSKIFTKLFRADNVRDKDTDGTGLGLYIVKSIVENSGGKIWFTSSTEGKNKGTNFYVALPLSGTKISK